MTIIVKDGRFHAPAQQEQNDFEQLNKDGAIAATILSVDLKSDTLPEKLDLIPESVRFIRIEFPTSADGRGFSLAKALREKGFSGHLRAAGHMLADQYPLALRSGFDDVEISDELAARQPEEQWAEALIRIKDTYQDRLLGARGKTQNTMQVA